jgi:hypothetical protein
MELERIKRESNAMIALLNQLEKEEKELVLQNKILAREALLSGYCVDSVFAPQQRREQSRKKKPSCVMTLTENSNKNIDPSA